MRSFIIFTHQVQVLARPEVPKVQSADHQRFPLASFMWSTEQLGLQKHYETKLIKIHEQVVLKGQDTCGIN
jgi:hypothetical protein